MVGVLSFFYQKVAQSAHSDFNAYWQCLNFDILFCFLHFGRRKKCRIENLFDAVWWAFSTVTTVGYGDLVPVTLEGRFVSILLMLMGTGLFVAHTALLANAFLDRKMFLLFDKKQKQDQNEVAPQETVDHILQDIKQKVDHLDRFLAKENKKN